MLRMFSPKSQDEPSEHDKDLDKKRESGDVASPRRAHGLSPDCDSVVLEQLAQLGRAQSRQEEKLQCIQEQVAKLIRSFQSAGSTTKCSASGGEYARRNSVPLEAYSDALHGQVRFPQYVPARRRGFGTRRRSSWTWDPQVQTDLELAFKVRFERISIALSALPTPC